MNSIPALATAVVWGATLWAGGPRLPAQVDDRAAVAPTPPDPEPSELAGRLIRYTEDLAALKRKYTVRLSGRRLERLRRFQRDTLAGLAGLEFARLSKPAQVDYRILETEARRRLAHLDAEQARNEFVRARLPFVATVVDLVERREDIAPVEAKATADRVHTLARAIGSKAASFDVDRLDPAQRLDTSRRLRELAGAFSAWFRFRDGYDPDFSWWLRAPVQEAEQAFDRLQTRLDAGRSAASVIGVPIGKEALQRELGFEWIPYRPSELIAIAEREFAWCDERMADAAEAMGFGRSDWRRAQEKVKDRHVEPGEQPALILMLAREAEDYLEQNGLVTVSDLCRESWRMEMMSPRRQLVNPYFTGGEVISVSFPTDDMAHEAKCMSMRGNNEHFARATVHHELIPGHHLQRFMQARYRPYRLPFGTPFWLEGWALYWEMLLWDRGFARSPEDQIGMLFWRKHRCARIVFSLRYHSGDWTEQQCIDYLVERVGHERRNAEAEVRRSVIGGYEPLYQAAYMLGGLQLRALRREIVGAGKMTDRQFHDAILRENSIPIELLRATLTDAPVPKTAGWRGL